MRPTFAYSYACLYKCQLLTVYILILFDNYFYHFVLNLHHKFMIKVNTTSAINLIRIGDTLTNNWYPMKYFLILSKWVTMLSDWSMKKGSPPQARWKVPPKPCVQASSLCHYFMSLEHKINPSYEKAMPG